jgi:hypothetical protein
MKPSTILLKLLYWLAVLAVSLVLVVLLILFFESRDKSSLGEPGARAGVVA